MTPEGIWIADNKKEVKLLREKTVDFDFSAGGGSSSEGKKYSKKELQDLIRRMREIMKKANGIGLSANQIGIGLNLFIAQVGSKFYAVLNPKFIKISEEKEIMEEGCLSVPEVFGNVERSSKVILKGFDKNGKKIKIKAWGILARVFQHEYDHLNGRLFIDKAQSLRRYEKNKK